jgi:hypothetical protein
VLRADAQHYSNAVPIPQNRQKWVSRSSIGAFRRPRLGEFRQRSVGNIRYLPRVEAAKFDEEYD